MVFNADYVFYLLEVRLKTFLKNVIPVVEEFILKLLVP